MLVLEARPAAVEATLPFAALADLLEPLEGRLHEALPGPQRRALDAALQRGPLAEPASRFALARAVLAILRAQAAAAPIAITVDDAQWLDPPSAQVIAFLLRRGAGERVLVSRRSQDGERLPLALDSARGLRVEQLRVGPLGPIGLGRIIEEELGARLPRSTLLRLQRTAGGNPFYAIEILRSALNEYGRAPSEDVLAVPQDIETLLRERLSPLSAAARNAALLCSAASHPTTRTIAAAAGSGDGIAEAVNGSLLRVKGQRLRFDHPLLASVVYASATDAERREAHRRLAGAVGPGERAIQLALATHSPDEKVAAEIEAAAVRAQRIAARAAAAELGEQALRLTPADSPSLGARTLAAADYWFRAGDTVRSRALLKQAAAAARPGSDRAAILHSLAIVSYKGDNLQTADEVLARAAREADDLALQAEIELARAFLAPGLGDVSGGIEHAHRALGLAERSGDRRLLALTLARVAASEFFGGLGLDRSRFEEAVSLERHVGEALVEWLPSSQYAWCAGFADDIGTARRLFERFHRPLIERDGELALALLVFQSQFELRAGDWSVADSMARRAFELSLFDVPAVDRAFALGARALVDAHLGRVDEARACADEGLRVAHESGAVPPLQLLLWGLGFLELSLGDPAAARTHLGPLAEITAAMGAGEPGIFRFLPDAIEALVELGELEAAATTLEILDERARAVERVSMIAAACRCRGLLEAARGNLPMARQALDEALDRHARLGQPFELGRTLVVQGMVERRERHPRLARDALQEALEVFDTLGAPLWSAKAATELARVPGRPRADGSALTETERRVADLVAEGRSNKEVAATLFVSVRTVEANLTKVYRKLGLRSRAELIRHRSSAAAAETMWDSTIEETPGKH